MATDSFDSAGLVIKSLNDLITDLGNEMKLIYGSDINLESDSPDGQLINIYCQMAIDLRELLVKINSGFDPDQAAGIILDQRVALNNIKRGGATFTVTPIEIVTDRALNLQGLDLQNTELNPTNSPYTVKDDAGTKFYLLTSQIIVAAGTYNIDFRAANIGKVETIVNTITIPDSIIAGITSVNNPDSASLVGIDEETDIALKIRRAKSTAISSTGFIDAIEAGLLSIIGVTFSIVYENPTALTDSKGIDPNGIWCIVEGGSDADIGNMIYSKRATGTPMKGLSTYTIVRSNGKTAIMKFDRPINENLYIDFNCVLINGIFDADNMKTLIVANVLFEVGADAVGSLITSYIQSLNSKYQITNMMVSNDGSHWYEVLSTTAANYKFVSSVARISITSI